MCVEIAIAKYTLIFSVLAGVIVLKIILGVLGISKRVKRVVIERVPLRLRILLQVEVLEGGEVSKGEIVRV